jgi:hypothetical protein
MKLSLKYTKILTWRGCFDEALAQAFSKKEGSPLQHRAKAVLAHWPKALKSIKIDEKITDEGVENLLDASIFLDLAHAKKWLNAANDFRLLRTCFEAENKQASQESSKINKFD